MPNNHPVSNEIPPNLIGMEIVHTFFFIFMDYEQIKYINESCCQFIESQPHRNLPEIWPNSRSHCPVQK